MSKIITADEVKKHNTRTSVWMVIRNDVYDVTRFLQEHPGGEEPLLEAGGQDATIAFDDVGHSADARAMLDKYKIGSLAPGHGCCKMKPKVWRPSCPTFDIPPSLVDDEKPWITYDGTSASQRPSYKSTYKAPETPRVERRVKAIVVPHDPSKLKWALLALGIAIIVGVAYKKYSSG